MRLPEVHTLEGVDVAVMGAPFDTGATFRVGARFGPEAIRSMSALVKPYNAHFGIDVFQHLSGVDYGDAPVVPGYTEESFARIEAALAPVLQAGAVPVVLGGDHSVSLPELRALSHPHERVALVHFDSHFDTAEEYFGRRYTHGTPFRRAVEEGIVEVGHSIQVGMRGSLYGREDGEASRSLGLEVITGEELEQIGTPAALRRIRERAAGAKVFVSFDIDVVDPAYAPGTGTIEVGGITSREALALVRGLEGLDFAGFDLVEVLPQYDPAGITASLAANIVFEFLSLLAVGKRAAQG